MRDYYNFAVQQTVQGLFADLAQEHRTRAAAGTYAAGGWTVTVRADQGIAGDRALPDDLVAAPP